MSARAIESFSEEIRVMMKEKGGQLEQTKKPGQRFPIQKLGHLGNFQKKWAI